MSSNVFSGMKGDPLRGPRIKINRANSHIDEIEREVASVFDGDAYALVIEPDPETGDRLAKIKMTKCVPDSLFLLVPEVIYHLRSSLDQLMVSIARNSGCDNVGHIYFPFGASADDIERQTQTIKRKKGKLVGIPADIQQEIIKLQPYKGGNDNLWALSRLSNVDKHGDLIPVGAVGGPSVMQNLFVQNAKIGIIVSGHGNLEEGIVISNLGQHGTIQGRGDNPHIQVTSQISFGNVDVFDGASVVPTLRDLSALTEDVIKTLSAHSFGI